MRHSWRLLLFRTHLCSRSNIPRPSPHPSSLSNPNLQSLRHLTLLFHTNPPHNSPPGLPFDAQVASLARPNNYFVARPFSSEPAVEVEDSDHAVVADAFAKFEDSEVAAKELELKNVTVSHDLVLKVLWSLSASPCAARKFFDWVSGRHSEALSSKSYDLMLGILGANGFISEFWGLFETMKGRGYGVSGRVRDKVLETFEKEGRESDAEKLRGVFASGSINNSLEKNPSRICRIVKNEVWSEDVEKKLRELDGKFSTDVVKIVLENLATEPMKALILFRWVEESGLFKHNEQTYNAMAIVLGREDCIDRFWKLVDEMKVAGYEMEMETYVKVLGRFCKRKMIKDAVYLYEFAMGGVIKPSPQEITFLLRKIAVSKDFDMGLFSRVVKVYTEKGNALTDSMLYTVLKSLASVGRLGESDKVLKVMQEYGFLPGGNLQNKIAFWLSSSGRKDEASKFMDTLESSGLTSDFTTTTSLMEGHCVSGDIEKASEYFHEMVKKEVGSSASRALDSLVNAYCDKNRALDACRILKDCASNHELKPWHTTYKLLIKKLLAQGGFEDALTLLSLMKEHGYPPFLDPFIQHISRKGTKDDVLAFLKAMTTKKFPSTSVFLKLFEAFFKVRRHNEAQELLSKCPRHIRNHADVLDLFCSKSKRHC
ncbi:pentatricopeptide repeat-containing protein At3g02490, mitochondrial-like [Rhodamnia argentea]|uniref:Pentatricopeptide repeat-containing protein At3g02490, mitochondrial-like n=1 Tax=Rhodamnia argentea TaxID=178133 RepID=A0A8B8QTR5_9MYRT|nr:pentatricopeptide repeat-containing protein At3g02490, mitochondrial-like [Rhodamnia argentea]